MAGTLNVDTLKADSNLKLQIASANVAFIDVNGLTIVGNSLNVGGGRISVTSNSAIINPTITTPTVSGNLSLDSTGTTGVRSPAANTLTFHTAGTEDMRIDSSGRVTMPAQPCFHARVNNGNYITTSPIPFSNAPINIGSNFNTSTYRFTAPIAGRYYFILMLYVRLSGSGDVTCFVRVNESNRQYLNYIIGSSTTEYNSITMPSIFSLSAGDYVDYTFTQTNGTYYGGNFETNLFGYLLG